MLKQPKGPLLHFSALWDCQKFSFFVLVEIFKKFSEIFDVSEGSLLHFFDNLQQTGFSKFKKSNTTFTILKTLRFLSIVYSADFRRSHLVDFWKHPLREVTPLILIKTCDFFNPKNLFLTEIQLFGNSISMEKLFMVVEERCLSQPSSCAGPGVHQWLKTNKDSIYPNAKNCWQKFWKSILLLKTYTSTFWWLYVWFAVWRSHVIILNNTCGMNVLYTTEGLN